MIKKTFSVPQNLGEKYAALLRSVIIDQLESNLKAIEGYLHIIDSPTCKRMLEAIRENISDIRSDIKDLKGTTEALQNTIKDNNYELSKVLEVE